MRRNQAPPTQWHRLGGTKRHDGSQTGWGEVVVGSCHMTSTPKVTLLQVKRKRDCSRKDLVDERLDQNKVLCSSSEVELLIVNHNTGSLALHAPKRRISGYLPAYDFRIALTRISSCCFFFVASLGTLFSAFYGLLLIPLCRKLDFCLAMDRAESRGADLGICFSK